MTWDAAPVARSRGGSAPGSTSTARSSMRERRFEAAVAEAGPGLADILWRVVCAGEGMRDAETRSAGRRGPASWCWARARSGRGSIYRDAPRHRAGHPPRQEDAR